MKNEESTGEYPVEKLNRIDVHNISHDNPTMELSNSFSVLSNLVGDNSDGI